MLHTFFARAEEELLVAIQLVWEFLSHLELRLSSAKIRQWGAIMYVLCVIATEGGMEACDSLAVLGVKWVLKGDSKSVHVKEKAGNAEATDSEESCSSSDTLCYQVSCGECRLLSILDFIRALAPALAFGLRGAVHKAIGQKHGALEIIFCACVSQPIGPYYQWLLAAIELWRRSALTEQAKTLLEHILANMRHSRMYLLEKHVLGLGWNIDIASLIASGSKPRGPKDQKNSRFRAGLKISSENEIFERATHRSPIFCGEIETSRLKFSSLKIKNFDRDQKFRSGSIFFDRWALWERLVWTRHEDIKPCIV